MSFLEKMWNKVNSKIDYAKVKEKTEYDMVFNDKLERTKKSLGKTKLSLMDFEHLLYLSSIEMKHEDDDTKEINRKYLDFLEEINTFIIQECLLFIADSKKDEKDKGEVMNHIRDVLFMFGFFLRKEQSIDTMKLLKNINKNKYITNFVEKSLFQTHIMDEVYAIKDYEQNDDLLPLSLIKKNIFFRKNKDFYGNNQQSIENNIRKFYQQNFESLKPENTKEQNLAINHRNLAQLEELIINFHSYLSHIYYENKFLFNHRKEIDLKLSSFLQIVVDLVNENVLDNFKLERERTINLMRIKSFKSEDNSMELCFNHIHVLYHTGCPKSEKAKIFDFLFDFINNKNNKNVLNNNFYQIIMTKNHRKNEVMVVKFNQEISEEKRQLVFDSIHNTMGQWIKGMFSHEESEELYNRKYFNLPLKKSEIVMRFRELNLSWDLSEKKNTNEAKKRKI